MKQKTCKNQKTVIGIICTAAAILLIGLISGLAGIFSVTGTAADPAELEEQVAALSSEEYKAVKEYNDYLDALTDEELDKVIDTSEDAVYEAPKKVKELCDTYGLRYASRMTELLTWADVQKEMAQKKLTGVFKAPMEHAAEQTAEEYGGGYSLDDGNLYLEIEQKGKTKKDGPVFITMDFSPAGVFPWQGYPVEAVQDEESSGQYFTFRTEDGSLFACMIEASEGIAFGKVGDYFLTMMVSEDQLETELEAYEQAVKQIEKKIKKETGLESLEDLEEKVYSGLETAWEKEPEAMQEAIDNDDSKGYEALQKKYSSANEEEIKLYETCSKELEQYEVEPELTREELEYFLGQLDFSKIV